MSILSRNVINLKQRRYIFDTFRTRMHLESDEEREWVTAKH